MAPTVTVTGVATAVVTAPKVAILDPAGTVTVGGTDSTEGLVLINVTTVSADTTVANSTVFAVVVLPLMIVVGLKRTAERTAGAPEVMLNDTLPVVPTGVVTDTGTVPAVAPDDMAKFAVICVGLTNTMFDTVIEAPALMLTGDVKLLPVSVTLTLLPTIPDPGVTDVSAGVAAVIVKDALPLVPLPVVTETGTAPGVAPAAIANLAVI